MEHPQNYVNLLNDSKAKLEIVKDMCSADQMDFPTQTGATIDVKTASKSYHIRILVPEDEYHDNPKDYYVGVEIDNDRARIRGMHCTATGTSKQCFGSLSIKV